MFDRIGSTTDPDAPRRNAASLGITVAMATAAIGFWTAWAAFVFVAPSAPPPLDDFPIEIVKLDAIEEVALPKAPEGAAPAPHKGEPAPVTPTEEPAEPQPLQDDPPDEQASTAGTPDGTPEGTGVVPGTGTGTGTGTGESGDGGGTPTVQSTSLRWKTRPAPSWPAAATSMGITEAVCTATVEFDAKGIATLVTFAECPGVFQRGARSAILRSRVEPFETGGKTGSVRTTIRIRYVLEE